MSVQKMVGREIPLLITFTVGLLTVSDYVIQEKALQDLSKTVQNWAVVITGFALGIGIINLLTLQLRRVEKRQKGWPYNMILAASLIVSALWGIIASTKNWAYEFVYFNLTVPLQVTIFALLIFYLAGAAFRSMRLRNMDAGIMLVSAVLVMLMNAPLGAVIWSQFPVIGSWVMDNLNVAGQRGLIIGVALGIVALGVRVFLGYERGYMGGEAS